MVSEGWKHSESVWRGSAIGRECQNMCPEPGVAHHRVHARSCIHLCQPPLPGHTCWAFVGPLFILVRAHFVPAGLFGLHSGSFVLICAILGFDGALCVPLVYVYIKLYK